MLKNPRIALVLAALAALVGLGVVAGEAKRNGNPSGGLHGEESELLQGLQSEGRASVTATPQGSKINQDAQAIRKATDDYSAAFNRGDVEGFLAHWDNDAEYIAEDGKVTRGRNALAVLFRKSLEQNKGSKLRVRITSSRFPKPDMALVDGSAELTSPNGTKDTDPFTSVWVKSDGRWMISRIRDLPGDAESGAPSGSDQLKQLEWLVGDWLDTVDKVDVRISCRWAEKQSFLVLKYYVKQEDKEFTMDQRIGWDPVNGQLRSWYFDSMGGFGDGLLSRDGNQWISHMAVTLPDGRRGSARNIVRFVNEKSWVFRSTDREVDGIPVADVEVGFARQSTKP